MKYLQYIIYSCIIFTLFFFLSSFFTSDDDSHLHYFAEFEGAKLSDFQKLQAQGGDSMQLALIDLYIEQGSEGNKDWDLKAKWAVYTDLNGDLQAEAPFINYWKGKKEEPFQIQGDKGRVLENNNLLILEENVLLVQQEMQLEGEYAEFLVNKELFLFPRGAFLTSPETVGTAQSVQWNTLNNTIQAEGDVVFILNHDNQTYTLDRDTHDYKDHLQNTQG